MSRKLPKEKIEEAAGNSVGLTERERKIFDLAQNEAGASSDNSSPYVVLKYFRESFECFSDWEKDELRLFSELIKDLRQRTWRQVLQTSGKKDGKRGLAYTPYDVSKVQSSAKEHLETIQKELSPDITFFELRVDQNKLRVHGFRAKSAFFLVLLDREHRVWPD